LKSKLFTIIEAIEKLLRKTKKSEPIEFETQLLMNNPKRHNNANSKIKEHKDRESKRERLHERNTSRDLWPETIDQIVEVGKSVKLER
jgi:hypothetical protein